MTKGARSKSNPGGIGGWNECCDRYSRKEGEVVRQKGG